MCEGARRVFGMWGLWLALAPAAASADDENGRGPAPAARAERAEPSEAKPGMLEQGADAAPDYGREHRLAWAIDAGLGELSVGQYETLGGATRLYLGVGFNMPESNEAPVGRGSLGYQVLGLVDRTAALHRHQLATTFHWWRFNMGVGGGASILSPFGTTELDTAMAAGGSFTVWFSGQLAGSAGFHAMAPLTVDVLRVGGERVVLMEIGIQIGFQRF